MSRSSQTDLVINRDNMPSPPSRRSETRSASRERDWRGWIRLVKPTPNDSFGIGLSEGLSSRGIYVSAIRPNSIADLSGLLHLYDRIIKVSSTYGQVTIKPQIDQTSSFVLHTAAALQFTSLLNQAQLIVCQGITLWLESLFRFSTAHQVSLL
ncbi:unnamed protein product [Dibothriocephalus latus]|uniref:PDZ domain-containing protein n=1 Tax=Dibothriocephalus latus TaxID=60516 RepID=A0A3P7NJM6_DIBLA|nr:unnamed protein product [Dibothriocephalus latus]